MEQLELFKPEQPQTKNHVKEWKLVSVRECPTPEELRYCDTPQKAADYWRFHVEGHPFFDPERLEHRQALLSHHRRKPRPAETFGRNSESGETEPRPLPAVPS